MNIETRLSKTRSKNQGNEQRGALWCTNITRFPYNSLSLFQQLGALLHASWQESKEGLNEIFKSEPCGKSSPLNNNARFRYAKDPLFSEEEHELEDSSSRSFGSKERRARKLGARRAAKENETVIREEHGGGI